MLPYEPAAQRWLLKLHGCVAPERRKDNVLTRGDSLSLREHRATLTGLVQALLVTRHMLFVGFGLADDHFRAVVHDVRRALGSGRDAARPVAATGPGRRGLSLAATCCDDGMEGGCEATARRVRGHAGRCLPRS